VKPLFTITFVLSCVAAPVSWWLFWIEYPPRVDLNTGIEGGGGYMVVVVLLALYAYVASLADNQVVEEMFGEGKTYAVVIGFVSAGVLLIGIVLSGLTQERPMEGGMTIGSFFFTLLIWLPCFLISGLIILSYPLLFGFTIVLIFPYFVMGLYTVFTTTRTLDAAQEHLSTKVPDDEIERRLAEAMKQDMADDAEIVKLLYQLGLFSRIKYTFIYKVRQKKYTEIWKLLKAQEEMLREQTTAARAAHGYERTKRGEHD
jgi:hypothetical protein